MIDRNPLDQTRAEDLSQGAPRFSARAAEIIARTFGVPPRLDGGLHPQLSKTMHADQTRDAGGVVAETFADAALDLKDAGVATPANADAMPMPASATAAPNSDGTDAKFLRVAATLPPEATVSKDVAESAPEPQTALKPESPPSATFGVARIDVAQSAAQGKVTALLDRKLGDVLLEAALKHPGEVGQLIAEAITNAEASSAAPEPTPSQPPVSGS